MDCRRASKVIFLYVDNEMEEELLVSFRKHLVLCPECARKIVHAQRVLSLFRQGCGRTRAPERLRQRILTSLPHRRVEFEGN
jgi:mycothiol system anti-sigma-R factor